VKNEIESERGTSPAVVGTAKKKQPHGSARVYEDKRYGTWYVLFHWKNQRYTSTYFKKKTDADILAARATSTLLALRSGHFSVPPGVKTDAFVFSGGKTEAPPAQAVVAKPVSISALLDKYLEQHARKTKAENTLRNEGFHVEHLRRFLRGEMKLHAPASEITFEVFEGYKAHRVEDDEVLPRTVNKELITFGNVFNYAADLKLVTRDFRREHIKSFTKCKKRLEPYLTGEEIEDKIKRGVFTKAQERALRRARILYLSEIPKLLEVVGGTSSYVPLAIAAYTGARRGEITKLTWADVNLDAEKPDIALRSKKQSREFPEVTRNQQIAPPLLAILRDYRKKTGGTGYLFSGEKPRTPIKASTLSTSLIKALGKDSEFGSIRFHGLRHTFASNLARVGVDPRVVNYLMGHTNDEIAGLYRHLYPEQKSEWITQLHGAGNTVEKKELNAATTPETGG